MMNTDTERLQTVSRALKVLDCFGGRSSWSVAELATKTGFNKTIVHRILRTLVAHGYVEQDPTSRRYLLGARLYQFAYSASRVELRVLAEPIMASLAQQSGESIYLTVPRNGFSVCIAKVDSPHEVKLMMQLGGVYPMCGGASNKVLLAFLPDEEREAYIRDHCETVQRDALRDDVQRAREQGYVMTVGEVTPGAFAIAVPVRDMDGRLLAGLSLGGPSFRLTPGRMEELRVLVQQAAAELERRMNGGRNPSYGVE